jgi:hypothetical protein
MKPWRPFGPVTPRGPTGPTGPRLPRAPKRPGSPIVTVILVGVCSCSRSLMKRCCATSSFASSLFSRFTVRAPEKQSAHAAAGSQPQPLRAAHRARTKRQQQQQ